MDSQLADYNVKAKAQLANHNTLVGHLDAVTKLLDVSQSENQQLQAVHASDAARVSHLQAGAANLEQFQQKHRDLQQTHQQALTQLQAHGAASVRLKSEHDKAQTTIKRVALEREGALKVKHKDELESERATVRASQEQRGKKSDMLHMLQRSRKPH